MSVKKSKTHINDGNVPNGIATRFKSKLPTKKGYVANNVVVFLNEAALNAHKTLLSAIYTNIVSCVCKFVYM